MASSLTSFMDGLSDAVRLPPLAKGPVQSLNKTRGYDRLHEVYGQEMCDEATVDQLFGKATRSYPAIKKESLRHRLILWATINGHKTGHIAALMNLCPRTVLTVQAQPWFKEAFLAITTEMGGDQFKATLEGEALPALQRVIELSKTAESETVRAAMNREILDRYLGKATVKVEQSGAMKVDHVVHDAAKLMDEDQKLSEQLRARGLN